MYLGGHGLRQIDAAVDLQRLAEELARVLLGKAVSSLKTARERLGLHASNSSRPPSTRSPREHMGTDDDRQVQTDGSSQDAEEGARAALIRLQWLDQL